MLEQNSPNRRKLLQTTGAAAVATIVAPHVLGGTQHTAPSDKVSVGVVGVGGRGLQNVRELLKLEDVVITAIADPAEHWDLSKYYYRGTAGRVPVAEEITQHYQKSLKDYECQQFTDYREMLANGESIDAVLCATPDHHHFGVSSAALAAGKHVYCEKPLTLFVNEAVELKRLAEASGLATQLGNQGHSNEGIRQTCEWIWAGAIGDVREVHAWVPATRWNKQLTQPPGAGQPQPEGLDWDLWCGPRAMVPFHEAYAPVSWRDFWQFGCGAMGDFGCHDLDSAVWALDLELPTSVEMRPAGQTHPGMTPYGELGYFDFERKSGPLRVYWYSGGPRPAHPTQIPTSERLPSRGVLFVGTEGVMLCGGAGGTPRLFPQSRKQEFKSPAPSIRRSNGHHRDWIDAVKGGPPASSNFSFGAHLTAITQLGVVALRSGNIVETDGRQVNVDSVGDEALLTGPPPRT